MKKLLFVSCLAIILPAIAADPPKKEPKAYTDPATAGRDYQIQGEYSIDGDHKRGVQVIADGDGKFTGRFLHGGLPGDGWDGERQIKFSAKTTEGKTMLEMAIPGETEKVTGLIADNKIAFTRPDGKTEELKRVVRHSSTEGAKPPAGAIVLFDGTNADAWDHGKIENGLLSVLVPGGQTSKQKFNDFTAHVEFILPFMPKSRGQARGNSGVYLQGRYEVQVLDSFALKGENNECAGVYTLAAPKVNMCYPPLQWQTYDIDFTAPKFDANGKKTTGARLTLKHNGVLVHDNVELKRITPGNLVPDNEKPGPIHLQNHGGDPVYYRNIWVVEKK